MGKMRTFWSAVVLLLCGGLAYQGWQNTRIPHRADAEADTIACDRLRACGGFEAAWTAVEVSPFSRRYHLDTSSGPVTVECRWSAVLFGEISCVADREEVAEQVEETAKPRPHELGRGNRPRR